MKKNMSSNKISMMNNIRRLYDIIKYSTDLDLAHFDDNAKNVLQLISKVTPNVCFVLRFA